MKSFARISRQGASLICTVALLATSFAYSFGQQQTVPGKRPLRHQDYDSWHSIQAPQISRDGKFVAYAFMAQDGDSEIVARNLATGAEWRAPRGYHPPVPPPDDPGANIAEFQATQARLTRPVFTADNRFVVFSAEPTKAEVARAKKLGSSPTVREDLRNALGIIDLSDGQVTRVERVKSFQVPEDGSGFIAYLLEPKGSTPAGMEGAGGKGAAQSTEAAANTTPTTSSLPKEPQASAAQSSGARPSGRTPKKEYGSDLVLRNTTSGTERTFSDVLDYTLSKDAKTLVFAVSSKKEETNGVYSVAPQKDAAPATLLAGKGKYQKLTWDEEQTELAFISDRDDAGAKQPKFKVYLWNRNAGSHRELRRKPDSGVPGRAARLGWGGKGGLKERPRDHRSFRRPGHAGRAREEFSGS